MMSQRHKFCVNSDQISKIEFHLLDRALIYSCRYRIPQNRDPLPEMLGFLKAAMASELSSGSLLITLA